MPILFILRILIVVSAIWVIYDVWTNTTKDKPTKALWTVMALLFSVITALVYIMIRKREESRKSN